MSFATRRGLVHLLWMHSSHRLVPLTWDPSRHMPCLESAPLLHRLPRPALSVIKEERSFLFRLPFVITTRDAESQGCFLSKRLLWQTSASLNQKGPASCLLLLGDSPETHLEPYCLVACSHTPGLDCSLRRDLEMDTAF